jgi:hypothetical protein
MKNSLEINKWIRWGYAIVLGLTFKFLLDVIFSLVYRNYKLLQPWNGYLVSIAYTFIVFEILLLFNKKLGRKRSWDKYPFQRFFQQFFINALIAILIIDGFRWTYRLLVGNIYYVRFLDEMILIGLIIFIILVFVIVDLSIFLMHKWRFSLAELERFKKENAEFRFESLRSQVNPHFLFNSLNTLSSLVYSSQEKAEQFIRELSDVYRYILENRENELITLAKELKVSNSYIFLNKIRFEKSLDVKINVPEKSKQLLIAPLTLQLLIENAIKHNIISVKRPLHLNIVLEDNHLVVQNNLQKKEVKEYSSALGLKNIESRYSFLTARKVDIIENENEFIVKIPLIEKG